MNKNTFFILMIIAIVVVLIVVSSKKDSILSVSENKILSDLYAKTKMLSASAEDIAIRQGYVDNVNAELKKIGSTIVITNLKNATAKQTCVAEGNVTCWQILGFCHCKVNKASN